MFRFEYNQNVVTKHHLGSTEKIHWTQAANWSFFNDLNKTSICSIKQVDPDTIEIVKRRDVKLGLLYWFGHDKKGLYERVTINRGAKTVSVDRIDANWWYDEPFLSQRDYFFLEKRENYPEQLTFVQHNFWVNSFYVAPIQLYSNFTAMSYARAFKRS